MALAVRHPTIEDFAGKLGLAPRTVAYWRERPTMMQRPERQRILDTTLEQAPDVVKARFSMLVDQHPGVLAPDEGDSSLPGLSQARNGPSAFQSPVNFSGASAADATNVLTWIESTNTSDDMISYFARAIAEAAEEHARRPPIVLLAKVQQLHGMIQALLRGGRQRYRQTSELLRLDADLLAHLCQLLGDVRHDQAASAYAGASLVLAEEAGSSSALAFSAQAQIARWHLPGSGWPPRTSQCRVLHSGSPFAGPSLGIPLGSSGRRTDVVTSIFTSAALPVDLGCPEQQGDNRDQQQQQVDHRAPPQKRVQSMPLSAACLRANHEQLFNETEAAIEPV